MSWRRSEWLSVGTIVMVCGWIWWTAQHADRWDVVSDQNIGNQALDKRLIIVETHIQDRDAEIIRLLRQMRDRE